MLLSGYSSIEISRPKCNPSFETLNCIAKTNEDIGEVLPYLNAALGGTDYYKDPPEVVFRHQGRNIRVGAHEIAINALKDEEEAKRVLEWIKNEINETWENRENITPCYKGKEKPKLIEILKRLPKTNCKKCGQPTCMVFATMVMEGGKGAEDCPELSEEKKAELIEYLSKFDLES